MKKTRLLFLLVLLMTAATGAWAQGYNVTFGGFSESEMNTTVNVTSLPYTFTAIGDDAFYPWTVISTSGNIFYNATVTSGGEGKVSANIANYDEMTITITGPFEGTATIHVTGEDDENRSISTDITVTCVAVGGASSGDSGDQTYSVTMKDGVKDADKWTVKVGDATEYQKLPLEGVAEGAALTLKYDGTKKVKSVKAVKKAEAPSLVIEDKNNYFGIGNQKFYFTEGETWTQAMANHPENAAAGWVIYNDRLRFKPDVHGYAIFILRSGDYYIIEDTILNQPIDTSKTYSFSGTNPT